MRRLGIVTLVISAFAACCATACSTALPYEPVSCEGVRVRQHPDTVVYMTGARTDSVKVFPLVIDVHRCGTAPQPLITRDTVRS